MRVPTAPFHRLVYRLVRRVPRGRVVTYGQVAALLGRPRAARAVGTALGALRGPLLTLVPWQRVVNAAGRVSRRSGLPATAQRDLLEREGVRFDRRGRVDLRRARWGSRGARRLVACLLLAAAASARAASPSCPDAATFPDTATIAAWSQAMADFGARPTASRGHRRFVAWLRRRMREMPGVELRADRFTVRRQLERSVTLAVERQDGTRIDLPTAGAVPYALLTERRGVTAPLVHVPPEQAIAAADVAGRIVVRDHQPSSLPYPVIQAVSIYLHDPGMTLASAGLYERDYLGYQGIVTDLREAAAGGAAGLVIVHEFPRAQVMGQYQPYEGVFWGVPALYLGVDEGRALEQMVADGSAAGATMAVAGSRRTARTRNLIATLPGSGPERIVVASHTDGMNAIWDNGPIAMLALARWFAELPLECRPRTLEFAFNSAHLYLSEHGAERYARGLDPDCERVALAVALEHLGATEYLAMPRGDGPGRVLVPSGQPEFTGIFVTGSAALESSAVAAVIRHDLRRNGVLPFIPGVVSGEGGTYQAHGFPTVAVIAGPWTLYNPAFGAEGVDADSLRRQTLAIRDLVLDVQDLPRAEIATGTTCPGG